MLSIDEALLNYIADGLVEQGYIVLDHAIPIELTDTLLRFFNQLSDKDFKQAGIGRQRHFQLQDTVRSDQIYWLDATREETEADRPIIQFLAWMDALRHGMNQRLFLGLYDYESHFATYKPGAFYKKHLDAFKKQGNLQQPSRVLSTVFYLNPEWTAADGGELVLYGEDEMTKLQTLSPNYGRLIIFLSEKFPHEVLPARRERKSIAGWFRSVNTGVA